MRHAEADFAPVVDLAAWRGAAARPTGTPRLAIVRGMNDGGDLLTRLAERGSMDAKKPAAPWSWGDGLSGLQRHVRWHLAPNLFRGSVATILCWLVITAGSMDLRFPFNGFLAPQVTHGAQSPPPMPPEDNPYVAPQGGKVVYFQGQQVRV